jgi:integrin alpha FG-GAP repeat containing protein 1
MLQKSNILYYFSWTLSIFIEPTEAILVVVIVTVLILLILGSIIIWKHIKEKEDDKKN